jgi:hypothetical protein
MEERIYYTDDRNKLMNDEDLKRRGFEFESAKTLGVDKPGSFFLIRAEKEFFDKSEALKEHSKEIKGKEKDTLLKKFNELKDDVASGIGLLD